MNDDLFGPHLLDRCISCGFCLPACPTYDSTGDEAASPRGRINLMRALQTGDLPLDDPTATEQASFCLGCRACEVVCPAGVEYGKLLEEWRDATWRGRSRPLPARLLMMAAGRPWLLRAMGVVRRSARRRPLAPDQPALMLGCFERALFPEVSRAALQLSPGLAVPRSQGCCGALHAHNGDLEGGRELARKLGRDLPGVIVTTAGGCAAHLAEVLGRDRVREFSEHVTAGAVAMRRLVIDGRLARVTFQDSCHLRNGLGVQVQPRALLRQVAEYVEIEGADRCCGAAGTYALLRPKDSMAILQPKLDAIEAAGVDYVVAVNPGCLRQLSTGLKRRGSSVRAVHLAELIAGALPTQ
ncbi:(Fe-S)-binding protein [Streptomyces sp. ISL-100]|uniref:(Fe-S)-binding protein n=1 Tax=Streptomyces sp. ISL-100 TaxID=2819173 RepID=UPI001BE96B25|nr:(Fe-S)-binding protein [Streptomyces sp. ISL-100]MBT2395391.1 (Fe-S)-binding protein [Streptomyces sp. ISL-100]